MIMRRLRSFGLAWAIACAVTLCALALFGASLFWPDTMVVPGLPAAAALLAALLALLATPLALAPGAMLRATLAGLAAGSSGAAVWGAGRRDLWGDIAAGIEGFRAASAKPPGPDPAIEMRRMAANLELTLRGTSEEIARLREGLGAAAGTLDHAAEAGARLSGLAEEAAIQLGEAVRRADDATGALALLPALANEQARSVEASAARIAATLETLEASAALAIAPPVPEPEPEPEPDPATEAIIRAADQLRRLDQVMPMLVEAIAQLSATSRADAANLIAAIDAVREAAASIADTTAAREAEQQASEVDARVLAETLTAGIGRLDDVIARAEAANEAVPDIAAMVAPAIARIDTAAETLGTAAASAVEAAAVRLADIAEVMAHETAGRVGEAAARVEAASLALDDRVSAVAEMAVPAQALVEAAGEASRTLGDIAAATAALPAIAAQAEQTIAGLDHAASRFTTQASEAAAHVQGGILRWLDQAEVLLERIDAAAQRPLPTPTAPPMTAPQADDASPIPVEGGEALHSVAARLLAELDQAEMGGGPSLALALSRLDGVEAEVTRLLADAQGLAGGTMPEPMRRAAPGLLGSVETTIRRLQSVAGAISQAADSGAAQPRQ